MTDLEPLDNYTATRLRDAFRSSDFDELERIVSREGLSVLLRPHELGPSIVSACNIEARTTRHRDALEGWLQGALEVGLSYPTDVLTLKALLRNEGFDPQRRARFLTDFVDRGVDVCAPIDHVECVYSEVMSGAEPVLWAAIQELSISEEAKVDAAVAAIQRVTYWVRSSIERALARLDECPRFDLPSRVMPSVPPLHAAVLCGSEEVLQAALDRTPDVTLAIPESRRQGLLLRETQDPRGNSSSMTVAAGLQAIDLLNQWRRGLEAAAMSWGKSKKSDRNENHRAHLLQYCARAERLLTARGAVLVPQTLDGLTLVVSGELTGYSREAAEQRLERLGARCVSGVSKKVSALIAGEKPGASKLNKAKQLGVPVVGHPEALQLLAGAPWPEANTDSGPAPAAGQGGAPERPKRGTTHTGSIHRFRVADGCAHRGARALWDPIGERSICGWCGKPASAVEIVGSEGIDQACVANLALRGFLTSDVAPTKRALTKLRAATQGLADDEPWDPASLLSRAGPRAAKPKQQHSGLESEQALFSSLLEGKDDLELLELHISCGGQEEAIAALRLLSYYPPLPPRWRYDSTQIAPRDFDQAGFAQRDGYVSTIDLGRVMRGMRLGLSAMESDDCRGLFGVLALGKNSDLSSRLYWLERAERERARAALLRQMELELDRRQRASHPALIDAEARHEFQQACPRLWEAFGCHAPERLARVLERWGGDSEAFTTSCERAAYRYCPEDSGLPLLLRRMQRDPELQDEDLRALTATLNPDVLRWLAPRLEPSAERDAIGDDDFWTRVQQDESWDPAQDGFLTETFSAPLHDAMRLLWTRTGEFPPCDLPFADESTLHTNMRAAFRETTPARLRLQDFDGLPSKGAEFHPLAEGEWLLGFHTEDVSAFVVAGVASKESVARYRQALEVARWADQRDDLVAVCGGAMMYATDPEEEQHCPIVIGVPLLRVDASDEAPSPGKSLAELMSGLTAAESALSDLRGELAALPIEFESRVALYLACCGPLGTTRLVYGVIEAGGEGPEYFRGTNMLQDPHEIGVVGISVLWGEDGAEELTLSEALDAQLQDEAKRLGLSGCKYHLLARHT